MRTHPKQVSSSHGFTLVELIIALSLVGLIVLFLFSGLRLGTRVWESVETAAERTAAPRIAHGFLARTLAQIRPARVTFDAEDRLIFGGDAENLEFVAPLSEHVGTPGLYILRLTLEKNEPNRLILTRWLLHPDVLEGSGDVPEWEPFDGAAAVTEEQAYEEDLADGAYGRVAILDDVGELEFSYFGAPAGEADAEWNAEWLHEERMPAAVRVHLTTEQQSWPDLLVRLPQPGYLPVSERP